MLDISPTGSLAKNRYRGFDVPWTGIYSRLFRNLECIQLRVCCEKVCDCGGRLQSSLEPSIVVRVNLVEDLLIKGIDSLGVLIVLNLN